MKLRNNFSTETRFLFSENYQCWECGRNKWDALHHIVGRGLAKSKCESSPLNAAPICNFTCHLGQNMNSFEKREKYFKKTFEYLQLHGYKLNKIDEEFIEKYKYYYKNIWDYLPIMKKTKK